MLLLSDEEDLAGDLREACAGGAAEAIERGGRAAAGERLAALLAAFRRHSPARLLVQGLLQPLRPVLGEVTDANLPFGAGRRDRARQ